MVIFFGTGFYGRVASYKKQWIETKFFSIMFVPIFPIHSVFVTGWGFRERKGFDIETNVKSVIAVYARMATTPVAAFYLYAFCEAHFNLGFNTEIITGIIAILACIYFWFFFGKATPADIAVREKLGSVTGLYAQLHWLDFAKLSDMLYSYEQDYARRYPGQNWKADLTGGNAEPEKYPLWYVLALLNCMVYDIPSNDELYAKADGLYQPTVGE